MVGVLDSSARQFYYHEGILINFMVFIPKYIIPFLFTCKTCCLVIHWFQSHMYTTEPEELSWYSDWPWTEWPRGQSSDSSSIKNSQFCIVVQTGSGEHPPTHPLIHWVSGVKWLGHEADHSPLIIVKVKKSGSIHPLPHIASWCSAQFVSTGTNLPSHTQLNKLRPNYISLAFALMFYNHSSEVTHLIPPKPGMLLPST
jgi:hypothetical protein